MLLDLDILLPPKKKVKLNGTEYDLNTGIPTSIILAFQRELQIDPVAPEAMGAVKKLLLFAFSGYAEAAGLVESLTMEQMAATISYLFGIEGTDGKNG